MRGWVFLCLWRGTSAALAAAIDRKAAGVSDGHWDEKQDPTLVGRVTGVRFVRGSLRCDQPCRLRKCSLLLRSRSVVCHSVFRFCPRLDFGRVPFCAGRTPDGKRRMVRVGSRLHCCVYFRCIFTWTGTASLLVVVLGVQQLGPALSLWVAAKGDGGVAVFLLFREREGRGCGFRGSRRDVIDAFVGVCSSRSRPSALFGGLGGV